MRDYATLAVCAALLVGCGGSETGIDAKDGTHTGTTGDPVADISPAEIVWDAAPVGYSVSEQLSITNVGDGVLEIYEISLLNDTTDTFVFDNVSNVELEAGLGDTWEVTCDLEQDSPATASLRIRTNDPEKVEVTVPLTCNPAE